MNKSVIINRHIKNRVYYLCLVKLVFMCMPVLVSSSTGRSAASAQALKYSHLLYTLREQGPRSPAAPGQLQSC